MCYKLILHIMKSYKRNYIKYDYNLLKFYSTYHNLILLHDYTLIRNHIRCSTLIYAKCLSLYCNGTFNKPFRYIIHNSSLYCKSCSNAKNIIPKILTPIELKESYTLDLLINGFK